MPPSTASPTSYVDCNTHSFFLSPTSSNECKLIIIELKNTFYGINSFPIRIFKHISDLICVPLSKLIIESFTSGIFPISLKIASVVPIFKSGDRKILSNYRPISILPLKSKVFLKNVCIKD